MGRAQKIVMHLIALEVKRRQKYWNTFGFIPCGLSDTAIEQMRKIVKEKRIPKKEKERIMIEIRTFELTTEECQKQPENNK